MLQMMRLLGISSEKVVLLNARTKLMIQTHPIHELKEWSTGMGKAHDGLILEFRASKPWTLMAPSIDNLKSVTAALWEAMDTEGRFLETAAPQRDLLDLGERNFVMTFSLKPLHLIRTGLSLKMYQFFKL